MDYKRKITTGLFLFLGALASFVPYSASASWINQDFEAFNIGDLNGQGDWTVTSGSVSVSTTKAQSGSKSIYTQRGANAGLAKYTSNTDLLTVSDTITFSFNKGNASGGNPQRMEFRPRNDDNFDFCMVRTFDNTIELLHGEGAQVVTIGTFTPDTWTTVTINYDVENRKCRAKVDDNAYSDYFDFPINITTENQQITNFVIISFDQNYVYVDDVQFSTTALPPFYIVSPEHGDPVIDDSWITVEGVCPVDGANRVGFTNDCLGFEQIQYDLACTNGTFSGQFYKSGLSDWVIAREIDSVSGDCVDYDNLMDILQVTGIELIEGYPEDWYFNFDYYEDYDIRITAPVFDTALTLPSGSTSTNITFEFIYPQDQPANLNFNVKQYDKEGNELNASYHNQDLDNMTDTSNYTVSFDATSADPLFYVVQLVESGEMKRQYPFGIYVSDLDFIQNPDSFDYFFPRLVEELKKKIIFNYYFAFHDGFHDMFNASYTQASDDALDVTFKSVSGDGQYNLDVKIFSASDPRVKSFASGIRPYITAILWLVFALYVVFRITHLFSDNE